MVEYFKVIPFTIPTKFWLKPAFHPKTTRQLTILILVLKYHLTTMYLHLNLCSESKQASRATRASVHWTLSLVRLTGTSPFVAIHVNCTTGVYLWLVESVGIG